MTQQSDDLFLVVIAGGSGTRFWPKSTSKRPKQLLSFGADPLSLLARTVARFEDFVPETQRLIITTESLRDAVQAQGIPATVLAEPQGRNTAPCIYWAARHVAKKNPRAVMLVMPADHYIHYPEKFVTSIKTAARWARENDDLVTLGIKPSRPETGYGYLKLGRSFISEGPFTSVRKVAAFVEKPNLPKAQEFCASGDYLWNGGMFLWRAEVIIRAFDELMPEMSQVWEKAEGRVEKAYPGMTATSIDYGVMEKASNVVTFPLDCGWDDLGSWTSLENLAHLRDDLAGCSEANLTNQGALLAIESSRNIVDAPGRTVALLGVNDLIVVEQGESLLVAHKDRAQDIRRVVEELKKTRPDLV